MTHIPTRFLSWQKRLLDFEADTLDTTVEELGLENELEKSDREYQVDKDDLVSGE